MKTRLIGITGKAGVGKDTFANYLNACVNFERYSFAGPLKDACCLLFGWTRQQIDHDRVFKEAIDPRWGFSPRRAMQLMGTEYGREMLRDDIWVHMAQVRLNETAAPGLMITDVRFQNEADWIRLNKGVLIHVTRPESTEVPTHASEAGVDLKDGDLIVNNVGSLDHLAMVAQNIANNLRLRG